MAEIPTRRLRKRVPLVPPAAAESTLEENPKPKRGRKGELKAPKKEIIASKPAEPWKKLAMLLSPSEYTAVEEVVLAIDQPAQYDECFPERLDNRGMESIADGPVNALIDVLAKRKLSFRADRKSDFSTFVEDMLDVAPEGIVKHPAIARMKKELEKELDDHDARYTDHLPKALPYLKETGFALLDVYNESDEANYFIVMESLVKDIIALSKQAGCSISAEVV